MISDFPQRCGEVSQTVVLYLYLYFYQARVICKLYEAVAGVQRSKVCGSDGVRSRTNAGTLNDSVRYRLRGRHLAFVHGPVGVATEERHHQVVHVHR